MLGELGSRLIAAQGPGHVVARMGGDEFAVLVTQFSRLDEVTGLAEWLRSELGRPCESPGFPVSVTGSIQVAGQRIQVGVVHARKLVTVALDEHTVTVYDAAIPIKAVPRRSTTDLNRTKAKHQVTV